MCISVHVIVNAYMLNKISLVVMETRYVIHLTMKEMFFEIMPSLYGLLSK